MVNPFFKGWVIAATFQAVLLGLCALIYSVATPAESKLTLGIGIAPIYGERKPFTETLLTATYRLESVQIYGTRTPITYIVGAEAIYPLPELSKGLELFLGFAYQTEHKQNYIVGSPIMYSFGFQFPVYDAWRFVFRHQSSGNYLRGPLCGSRHRCDNVANSGWNSFNLEYVWLF